MPSRFIGVFIWRDGSFPKLTASHGARHGFGMNRPFGLTNRPAPGMTPSRPQTKLSGKRHLEVRRLVPLLRTQPRFQRERPVCRIQRLRVIPQLRVDRCQPLLHPVPCDSAIYRVQGGFPAQCFPEKLHQRRIHDIGFQRRTAATVASNSTRGKRNTNRSEPIPRARAPGAPPPKNSHSTFPFECRNNPKSDFEAERVLLIAR